MRLPEPERREFGENIIPLINIVFLLLIFFMLAGTLTPPDMFDVEPPETREARMEDEPEEGVILLSRDGKLAFEGEEMDLAGLSAAVAERLQDEEPPTLTLKADSGVPASLLLDLMDALRDAGAESIMLLTTPEA